MTVKELTDLLYEAGNGRDEVEFRVIGHMIRTEMRKTERGAVYAVYTLVR